MMKTTGRRTRAPSRQTVQGFTLVEFLVGAGLGLVSMVLIATVLASAEKNKRSSSSGADADVAGSLAIFELERAVKNAGYGLSASTSGCALTATFNGLAVPGIPTKLASVQIRAGAAGAPDQLRVLTGSPARIPLPMQIKAVTSDAFGSTYGLSSRLGVINNDLMAVVIPSDPQSSCVLFQATLPTSGAATNAIQRVNDTKWNLRTQAPSVDVSKPVYVINLTGLQDTTFSIANTGQGKQHRLHRAEFDWLTLASSEQDLHAGIVDLRAYYGLDTNNDQTVDVYTKEAQTTTAGWQQLRTVRLALLARSAHFEKEQVTATAPLWNLGRAVEVKGADVKDCEDDHCVPLNTGGGTDWRHYRYKLFDVVVPVRNHVWTP